MGPAAGTHYSPVATTKSEARYPQPGRVHAGLWAAARQASGAVAGSLARSAAAIRCQAWTLDANPFEAQAHVIEATRKALQRQKATPAGRRDGHRQNAHGHGGDPRPRRRPALPGLGVLSGPAGQQMGTGNPRDHPRCRGHPDRNVEELAAPGPEPRSQAARSGTSSPATGPSWVQVAAGFCRLQHL